MMLSLIADPGLCVIFPKLIVPMETAQFMLLFLDALLTYATELDFKEKGRSCGFFRCAYAQPACTTPSFQIYFHGGGFMHVATYFHSHVHLYMYL